MEERSVAGYILAGGRNRRMNGRKKAFLSYHGKQFYEWIAESLGQLGRVYLSVEEEAYYRQTELPVIVDIYQGIGPLGAIFTGLSKCREDALLVVPCDVPKISREMIAQMAACYKKTGSLVFFEVDGRVSTLPGIYTKDCLPMIEEMIQNKRYCVKEIIERMPHEVIHAEGKFLDNINTTVDYERLVQEEE